jgi:DNA-binding NarL/FixJ family response regulator
LTTGDGPRGIGVRWLGRLLHVFGALRAGASGFLPKRSPPEQLVQAVKTVAAGESVLAPTVTRRVCRTQLRNDSEPISNCRAIRVITPNDSPEDLR